MDLRTLKQEIDSLPGIPYLCRQFQEDWVKPLRGTAATTSLLQGLDHSLQKEAYPKVAHAQKLLQEIQSHQIIPEKLHHYARSLTELKLASLRKDLASFGLIQKRLERDEFLNLKTIAQEMDAYQQKVLLLKQEYQLVNGLLSRLPLENLISFLELPHQRHLHSLQKLARDYSRIAQDLHQSFSSLVAEKSDGNIPHSKY